MISEKLINEIFELDNTIRNLDTAHSSNEVMYSTWVDMYAEYIVNIYELAYMCKSWASKLPDKELIVSWTSTVSPGYGLATIEGTDEVFSAPTEPEAILKAGEWLLKEIK